MIWIVIRILIHYHFIRLWSQTIMLAKISLVSSSHVWLTQGVDFSSLDTLRCWICIIEVHIYANMCYVHDLDSLSDSFCNGWLILCIYIHCNILMWIVLLCDMQIGYEIIKRQWDSLRILTIIISHWWWIKNITYIFFNIYVPSLWFKVHKK